MPPDSKLLRKMIVLRAMPADNGVNVTQAIVQHHWGTPDPMVRKMIVYRIRKNWRNRVKTTTVIARSRPKGGDVVISRKAATTGKMFGEWANFRLFLLFSSKLIVPLYQEIATSELCPSSQ